MYDLKCNINRKLIYNNNNSFNSLCPIMKSQELPGNKTIITLTNKITITRYFSVK